MAESCDRDAVPADDPIKRGPCVDCEPLAPFVRKILDSNASHEDIRRILNICLIASERCACIVNLIYFFEKHRRVKLTLDRISDISLIRELGRVDKLPLPNRWEEYMTLLRKLIV